MESQLQNPEFRKNPENFLPCMFAPKNQNMVLQDTFIRKMHVGRDAQKNRHENSLPLPKKFARGIT